MEGPETRNRVVRSFRRGFQVYKRGPSFGQITIPNEVSKGKSVPSVRTRRITNYRFVLQYIKQVKRSTKDTFNSDR